MPLPHIERIAIQECIKGVFRVKRSWFEKISKKGHDYTLSPKKNRIRLTNEWSITCGKLQFLCFIKILKHVLIFLWLRKVSLLHLISTLMKIFISDINANFVDILFKYCNFTCSEIKVIKLKDIVIKLLRINIIYVTAFTNYV